MLAVQINAVPQRNRNVRKRGSKPGLAYRRIPPIGEDAGGVGAFACVIEEVKLDGDAAADASIAQPICIASQRVGPGILDGKGQPASRGPRRVALNEREFGAEL